MKSKYPYEEFSPDEGYVERNLTYRDTVVNKAQNDPTFQALLMSMCQEDFLFWINTFCYTYNPRVDRMHLPFVTFPYQDELALDIIDAVETGEDIFIDKSRDMGLSWLVLSIFVWGWLFKEWELRVGSRNRDYVDKGGDMNSLFEKMRYIIERLPSWMVPYKFDLERGTKYNSSAKLVNPKTGNTIVGEATSPNFARGGRSKAILYDEFAFWTCADEAWKGGADTTNCRILISCVAPQTIIFSDKGMLPIGEVMDKEKQGLYVDKNISLFGRYGIRRTNQYYNSGVAETRKITTKAGYNLESSLIHPVLTINQDGLYWKKAGDLEEGDYLAVQYGQNFFGSESRIPVEFSRGKKPFLYKEVDEDLAYLCGLHLAEGYIHQNFQVVITNSDKEIQDFLIKRGFTLEKDGIHLRNADSNLVDFLRWLGFDQLKAKNKVIPNRVLKWPKHLVREFIRGMFDGDGTTDKKRKRVSYCSASEEMIDVLQVILLNFGIVSHKYYYETKPTKKVKVTSERFVLEMNSTDAVNFHKEIGFRLSRKQRKWEQKSFGRKIPYGREILRKLKIPRGEKAQWNNYLTLKSKNKFLCQESFKKIAEKYGSEAEKEIANLNVFWDKVEIIKSGESEVYDFHIPDGNSFTTNGIISHNTPNGMNNKFADVKHDTDLKIRKRSILWKLHPFKDEDWYQTETKRRTPQELAQEVDISYTASATNRVYEDFVNVPIGQGPAFDYNPELPLYRFWDFSEGGSDATAIIWAQEDPDTKVVRIIDCFQREDVDINYFGCLINGQMNGDFFFDAEALALMDRQRSWKPAIDIGDPYSGNKKTFIGQTTIKKELANHGIRLNLNQGVNSVMERIRITTMLLKRMVVHERCAGKDGFVEAMQNSRWPKRERTSDFTSPSKKPVHNRYSHLRTALEYGAEYLENYKTQHSKRKLFRPSRSRTGYRDNYKNILK